MEKGVGSAIRVLAVTASSCVDKANAATGGVGYERRLLTADLMKDLTSDKIIPLMRDNQEGTLPRFLGAARYLDFRDDAHYEDNYAELIYVLHGRQIQPRPALGPSPFEIHPEAEVPLALRHDPARYESPNLAGAGTFDHSNNNGKYRLGAGDMAFTLATSEAGLHHVYVLNDPVDIKSIALAPGITEPTDVRDATRYDASSLTRMIRRGDAAILWNRNDYWCVVCVDEVLTRDTSHDGKPALRFRYAIQPNRTPEFTNLRRPTPVDH